MVEENHLNGEETIRIHPFKLRIGVTGHRRELNVISGKDLKRPAPDIKAIRAIIREVLILISAAFREAILTRIQKNDPASIEKPEIDLGIISALASGADQWVADEAIKLGFKLEAVLPFNRDEYLRDFSNRIDTESYIYLIDHATEITEFDGEIWIDETGKRKHEGNSYEIAGNEIIIRSDILIAVWDGKDPHGKGGTGQVVKDAQKKGMPVIWIPWSAPEKWCVGLPQDFGNPEPDELIGEKDRLMKIIRNLMQSDEMKFHKNLASYFMGKPLYLDDSAIKKPNIRKLVEQPWQQTKGEMWDEVTDTLCNLDFIQAKAAAKMTFELVNDFNAVMKFMPDNASNNHYEIEQKARLDKYTQDLIACAKGDIPIDELEIPRSLIPMNNGSTDAKIERVKNYPTKVDRIKEHLNFLGLEAYNLQKYATEFPHIATQQAWNYSDNGLIFYSIKEKEQITSQSTLILARMDRLNWRPLSQVLKVLKGHRSRVTSLAITVDGKFALSGSDDHNCILWDLTSGNIKGFLRGHTDWVYSVSITPDASLALSGSKDKTCILWNLNTCLPIYTLRGHTSRVYSVDITPDGKYGVSASEDKTCILWDLSTGQSLKFLTGHAKEVHAVFMTPNGKKAISSSGGSYIIWNLAEGKSDFTFEGHYGLHGITSDGKRAIWSSDTSFGLIDLTSNSQTRILKHRSINSMAITADGSVAVLGSSDGDCSLWDLTEFKLLKILNGHYWPVSAVAITPDGRSAISGSNDGICILWNLMSGKANKKIDLQNSFISTFVVTPDGRKALSCHSNGIVTLCNALTGDSIFRLDLSERGITASAVSHNGDKAIIGSDKGACTTIDLNTGNHISVKNGTGSRISTFVITPDGKRAIAGSWDNTCTLWDLTTGQMVKTLKGHTHVVNSVILTRDGKRAISGSWDHKCIVWDIPTGQLINIFDKHVDVITFIVITPDNKRVLSASKDGKCFLWNIESCEPIIEFNVCSSRINSISLTPKGNQAIIGSSVSSSLWDLTIGKLIQIQDLPTLEVSVTKDGKLAISVSEDATFWWEIETGKRLACLPDTIGPIGFSQNGFILHRRGDMTLFNINNNLLVFGESVTSIRHIWDFKLHQYQDISADCPLCGHRFAPAASVLRTIEKITTKAGLKPNQSPCLELPDEAWEDPGLLGICPKCGEKLKFNPFIAGGD